jgi:endoglucanase
MKRVVTGLVSIVMLAFAATAWAGLLSQGDFEQGGSEWKLPKGAAILEEGGNHFLRLEADGPDQMIIVSRKVELGPEQRALAMSFRARHAEIKVGKESWHDGRVMLDFRDALGNKLPGSPSAPYFKKQPRDWQGRRLEFLVPEGAVSLEISPALFRVAHGSIDFDDFVLEAVPAEPVKERLLAKEEERSRETARRAAQVKPSVPAVPADRMPAELKVSGNRIVTVDGKEVWLQGLSIPSLEWTEAGEHILESAKVAIEDWKANCIRLPVNAKFWAGRGPYGKDGGAAYRQLVEDVANFCAARGAYLVLDLHGFRAPEEGDLKFWESATERFKNNPGVLFELFNEPHDISWDVWQKGGPVTDEKGSSTVIAENGEKPRGFHSVGMQALIDAVRKSGARNIVIVGGLDWGYDLSGILNGHALDDRGGNGIVYSSHVYPWKRDWQGKFLALADKYPLFIGELGAEPKPMPFERPENFEDPFAWSPDMLALIQKHRLHWTGWCFHPQATPRIITGWNYEPTPFWGAFVKKALAGEKFEMQRLR